MNEIDVLINMGFDKNLDYLEEPDPDTILARIYGWDVTIEYQAVCLFKAGLWLSYSHSESLDYDDFVAKIRTKLSNSKRGKKPKQLSLF